jgi:hypothetical protein
MSTVRVRPLFLPVPTPPFHNVVSLLPALPCTSILTARANNDTSLPDYHVATNHPSRRCCSFEDHRRKLYRRRSSTSRSLAQTVVVYLCGHQGQGLGLNSTSGVKAVAGVKRNALGDVSNKAKVRFPLHSFAELTLSPP